MECRKDCGACCIAPSITSALPGMPLGKPAGLSCANLDTDSMRCRIWGRADYPELCRSFAACATVCGENRDEALQLITLMERQTR